MGRDTTSSNTTLPIGQVFKSSGTLVYKHIFFGVLGDSHSPRQILCNTSGGISG